MKTWAGNLIWLARRKQGLSQRKLAERARTSQATIAAYEAGRKQPSLDTLARIVRAAGLDLRVTLAALDDHDDRMRAYEAALPAKVVQRRRKRDLATINRARRTRGLPPVREQDLVRG